MLTQVQACARAVPVVALLLVVACTPAPPAATPTIALPTPIPTSGQNVAAPVADDRSDVQVAFRTEVQQVVQQARILTNGSCDRLREALRQDSSIVTSLRNYATLLNTVSTQDQALEEPATLDALKRMGDAMADLDDKLASCGISII
jgi:hypothetical protein